MKNNKGFSLVELIVVIAIMAILAAVAIPTFATFITKANEAADKDFANGIEYAVNLALTTDGDKAEEINVVWDADAKEISKLTYTLAGEEVAEGETATVYVVIGTPAANSTEVAADAEIAADILATIDREYDLKSGADVTDGDVTITVD